MHLRRLQLRGGLDHLLQSEVHLQPVQLRPLHVWPGDRYRLTSPEPAGPVCPAGGVPAGSRTEATRRHGWVEWPTGYNRLRMKRGLP